MVVVGSGVDHQQRRQGQAGDGQVVGQVRGTGPPELKVSARDKIHRIALDTGCGMKQHTAT